MSIHQNQFDHVFGADTALGVILGDEPCGTAFDLMTMQMLTRDNRYPPVQAPDMVVNGNFDVASTAGWTVYVASGTPGSLAVVGGVLRFTQTSTGSTAAAVYAVTTEIGKTYRFSYRLLSTTASIGNHRMKVGTTAGGAEVGLFSTIVGTTVGVFTATTTTTYLGLSCNAVSCTSDFDDVSLRSAGNYVGPIIINTHAALTKHIFDAFGDFRALPHPSCDHNLASLDSSVTTLSTLGIGSGQTVRKTIETTGAYAYQPGQMIRVTDAADITRWMLGRFVSFSGTTLVIDAYAASGAFSASSWKIIVALGLLTDPARTNYCPYSQDFDNAAWIKTAVTVAANATTAPDGTTTADKMIGSNTTASMMLVSGNFTAIVNSVYMLSVYAKAGGANYLQITSTGTGAGTGPTGFLNFDLTNGTVGSSSIWTGYTERLKDGWWRCVVYTEQIYTAGASTLRLALVPAADSPKDAAFTGNGADGVYLWGAQVEGSNVVFSVANAYAHTYIPTTAAFLLRAGDIISLGAVMLPVPDAPVGTLLWTGWSNNFDTGGGTGINSLQAVGLGTSPDTGSATHYVTLAKSDTTTRNGRVNGVFKYEAEASSTIEAGADFSFPVAPPGNTLGLTWNATMRMLMTSVAPGVVTTSAHNLTVPTRFRHAFIGNGTIQMHHRSAVYLPRTLTQSELERRCFAAI